MPDTIIQISDDFWNLRGVYRVGPINLGTHCSLIRRTNGNFLMLDSYTLDLDQKKLVMDLTDNGAKLDAVLNLHPFHTLHVENMRRDFPNAKFYGTTRHHTRFPDIDWQPELCESDDFAALFAEDLEFSVPKGVHFISKNEKVHFASVMAYHPISRTIHVDDTLTFIRPPKLLAGLGMGERVGFHPTLKHVLIRKPGATDDFRSWARDLAERWGDTQTLCAAHVSYPFTPAPGQPTIQSRILTALDKVEPVLKKHDAALNTA